MVGLHVQSRGVTITTHRSGISFAASIDVFETSPFFWTETFPFPNAEKNLMPWSHLSRVLIAGTGQSTTDSWLLLGCSFLNIVGLPSVVDGGAALSEKVSSFVASKRPREHVVIHHLCKLSDFGKACCQFACALVGSTCVIFLVPAPSNGPAFSVHA